jgi:hypothetical protein
MGTSASSISRRLIVCAATLALTASGPVAAAAATHHARSSSARPGPRDARPLGGPNFAGIYLSTWGTAHVTFGRAFKSWLARTGATVSAQAPVTLDADRDGFTMPASPVRQTGYQLDARGRMVYPGALVISLPAKARVHVHSQRQTLRFGPFYIMVVPDVAWNAALSVNGVPAADEVELATADYSEVLAGGGPPSPSGFRADRVPFHLTQDTAALLAHEGGRAAPAPGSLFGTLTPRFDHVPTEG